MNIGSAVVTAMPLSMAIRGSTSILGSTVGVAMVMMGLGNSANGYPANTYLLFIGTGNVASAHCQGSAGFAANTTNIISVNTEFSAVGIFTSATSRRVILDGNIAGAGTDTNNTGTPTVNRTFIGAFAGSAVNHAFAAGGTGILAWAAMWNAALSDADALMWHAGAPPWAVKPQNLVAFWPITGKASPELNYKSRTTVLTINGTLPAAANPRVFLSHSTETLKHAVYVAPPAGGKHRFFQVF